MAVFSRPQTPVATGGRGKRRLMENIWGYLFILPQFIGFLIFMFIPLLSVFILSFMQWDGLTTPAFVGLDNFRNQLTDPDFRTGLFNSTYYTILVVPGGIALALLVALGLNKVRGREIYRVFYFMPVVTSSVAISVVWLWLLNGDFGLINQLLSQYFHIEGPHWLTDTNLVMPSISVVSVWWGLGSNMILFLAGLQGISSTYLDAARIDGANRWELFWRVTFPLLSPTLFFVTVLSIIGSFQVFDQVFIMTSGGPAKASYVLVFHLFNLAFQKFDFGNASAAAVLLFFILLSLTIVQFVLQKRWVHYD